MGFQCGIIGLPNVGKSTLFNALTATQAAEAANYPFCTIEPNVGRVAIPDTRLETLAKLAQSAKVIPTQIEFVDIAGLVRGASKGEGLGNQFLSHIREVDAVAHVLRCFEDSDITHVEGSVDPVRDAGIIETELLLADLASLEKRAQNVAKKAKGNDKDAKAEIEVIDALLPALNDGKPARTVSLTPEQHAIAKHLHLLTSKPILYVANVKEEEAATGNAHTAKVAEYAASQGARMVVISAAIEAEVASLADAAEKQEYLATLGLAEAGLYQVIREGYALLNLITFFTVGPKEARAWTVHKGAFAPQAAGVIHTDFQRGFIRAETIAYADYVSCGTEAAAKEQGKMRAEGKDYTVQDGDVFHFRFNV